MVASTPRLDQLRERQVHLWCTYTQDLRDPGLEVSYRELLNEREKAQQQRFHFEKDRRRYLLTRALVRTALSAYADVAPQDWQFGTNAWGRPHIEHPDAAVRALDFNVSHTDTLVILAVMHDLAAGVDTENAARDASIDVADRFFAPEETAALRALPEAQQRQRFFEHWTLKESYIKARGMGLSIPLDQFGFQLDDPGRIGFFTRPSLQDPAHAWRFWQLRLPGNHLVAVCTRREAREPRLVWRRVVPRVSDEPLAVEALRASPDPAA